MKGRRFPEINVLTARMSVDILNGRLNDLPDSQQQFDLLLNMIGSSSQLTPSSAENDTPSRRPQQRSRFASGEFPKEYDFSQPAKSWWRYFQKQTDTNTAMCYTCGAVFNRGPKQSTTSLSHHLKMYHREQFIFIQQAKDDDMKMNGKSKKMANKLTQKTKNETVEQDQEVQCSSNKKSAFNMLLIKAIKNRPEIYDPKCRNSDDDISVVWESVASEVGDDASVEIVRKRWLQMRDRYRKELKFAIRDNFAYKPKWPYFWDLEFLNDHLKDTSEKILPQKNSEKKRTLQMANNNEFQTLLDESNVATTLLTNIFNVVVPQPEDHEADSARSTDSAIASNSEHDSDDFESKSDAMLTIQRLIQEQKNEELSKSEEPPVKRPRAPRKSTPTRCSSNDAESCSSNNSVANDIAGEVSYDWVNDEDFLFGRFVAVRLRSLPPQAKRQVKILIEQLIQRHERAGDI